MHLLATFTRRSTCSTILSGESNRLSLGSMSLIRRQTGLQRERLALGEAFQWAPSVERVVTPAHSKQQTVLPLRNVSEVGVRASAIES